MGGSESKEKEWRENQYKAACALCSPQELQQLRQSYGQIADGGESDLMQFMNLRDSCHDYLADSVIKSLFSCLAHVSQDVSGSKASTHGKMVTSEGFITVIAHCLKGSSEELADVVTWLAFGDGHAEQVNEKLKLSNLLALIIRAYCCIESGSTAGQGFHFTAESSAAERYLMQWMMDQMKTKDPSLCIRTELDRWIYDTPAVQALFRSVIHQIAQWDPEPDLHLRLPTCASLLPVHYTSLLDIPSAFFLAQQMNPSHRDQWKLLYSSEINGESFARIERAITDQGACLVLVRVPDDSPGGQPEHHLFGGYSDKGFRWGSEFTGASNSFLFTISPTMEIFPATGYNTKYCYLNSGQQTLPNGLGMGGSFEAAGKGTSDHFFGLWLDSAFGSGQSNASAMTFGNKQLSPTKDFTYSHVEVWGLDPAVFAKEPSKVPQVSILDKDPEAKAIMAMANRGPHSEGLRDGDGAADNPGEKKLHHDHYTDLSP